MADATEKAADPGGAKKRPKGKGKSSGFRRKMIGTVRSSKMDKTVVVEVERYFRHGMYKKYVKTRERYMAHDPNNEFRRGDKIEIMASRPWSSQKRWIVTKMVAASAERLLEEAGFKDTEIKGDKSQ